LADRATTNMSCKVLPPESSHRAIRVVWPEAGKERKNGTGPAQGVNILRVGPAMKGPQTPSFSIQAATADSTAGAVSIPDVEAIRKEAYEKGLRDGRAASQQDSAAQLQPLLNRLSGMLASLAEQRARLRQEAESDLVRLSLAIAKRILNRELTVDPLSLQGLIRAALSKIERGECSQVRVSPGELETVQLCVSRLNLSSPLEVIADASLSSGAILFQTSKGVVDASVDTQLQEIERGFADRLRA
jgi:flagellar biosynthesis/type III secretory pathway protein FliH